MLEKGFRKLGPNYTRANVHPTRVYDMKNAHEAEIEFFKPCPNG